MSENTLAQRLEMILQEQSIRKKEFAASLGITANYVSLLVSGKRKGLSASLASKIEEKYGYSANWIINGAESGHAGKLSALKNELSIIIENMSLCEISATLAFIRTMKKIEGSEQNEKAVSHI